MASRVMLSAPCNLKDSAEHNCQPADAVKDNKAFSSLHNVCQLGPGIGELGLGTWDLGPRIWDWGPGTWDLGPGIWVSGPGTWVLEIET